MAGTVWLGLILLQYILTLYFLGTKRYTGFLIILLYSIFSYDFVFINASYHLPGRVINLLKPYSEYLVIFFGGWWIRRIVRDRALTAIDQAVLGLLIVPSLIALTVDLIFQFRPMDSLLGLRLYVLPILLPYLIYRAGVLGKVRRTHLVYGVLTLSVLTGIYAHFQLRYFQGDLHTLWFYRFFNKFGVNPVDYGWANYLRNSRLRITSIFVSPITMSLMMSIPILLVVSAMLNIGRRMKWHQVVVAVGLLGFALCYQWLTRTRIGVIVDVIGCSTLVLMKIRRDTFFRTMLIPIGLIGITSIALITRTAGDDSALGRLDQYRSFFDLYVLQGLGFSHPLVHTHFDAFFISAALLYGCLAIFPFILLFFFNYLIYKATKSRNGDYIAQATYGFSLALIYVFTFQFVAGSSPYRLYFLLLFITLAYVKSGTRASLQADRHHSLPD